MTALSILRQIDLYILVVIRVLELIRGLLLEGLAM